MFVVQAVTAIHTVVTVIRTVVIVVMDMHTKQRAAVSQLSLHHHGSVLSTGPTLCFLSGSVAAAFFSAQCDVYSYSIALLQVAILALIC